MCSHYFTHPSQHVALVGGLLASDEKVLRPAWVLELAVILGKQEAFTITLNLSMEATAAAAALAHFKLYSASACVAEASRVRSVLVDAGLEAAQSLCSAGGWYKLMTARIDMLQQVELELAKAIKQTAVKALKAALRDAHEEDERQRQQRLRPSYTRSTNSSSIGRGTGSRDSSSAPGLVNERRAAVQDESARAPQLQPAPSETRPSELPKMAGVCRPRPEPLGPGPVRHLGGGVEGSPPTPNIRSLRIAPHLKSRPRPKD